MKKIYITPSDIEKFKSKEISPYFNYDEYDTDVICSECHKGIMYHINDNELRCNNCFAIRKLRYFI